eukprot:7459609-Heterocapsa_arctica.AAC.1
MPLFRSHFGTIRAPPPTCTARPRAAGMLGGGPRGGGGSAQGCAAARTPSRRGSSAGPKA